MKSCFPFLDISSNHYNNFVILLNFGGGCLYFYLMPRLDISLITLNNHFHHPQILFLIIQFLHNSDIFNNIDVDINSIIEKSNSVWIFPFDKENIKSQMERTSGKLNSLPNNNLIHLL
jgi:hypothetical protein